MRLWTRLKYAWLTFRYPNAMSATISVVQAALHGKTECTLNYHDLDGTVRTSFYVTITEVVPHSQH